MWLASKFLKAHREHYSEEMPQADWLIRLPPSPLQIQKATRNLLPHVSNNTASKGRYQANVDGIYGRFSGFTNQQGEILENIYEDGAAPDTRLGSVGGGEDGYNDDTKAFRAQLLFDIGEEGSLLLSGNWSDTTKSEGPYQVVNTTEIKMPTAMWLT